MCQRLKPYSDKPKMAKLTVVRTGFTNNLAQRITLTLLYKVSCDTAESLEPLAPSAKAY